MPPSFDSPESRYRRYSNRYIAQRLNILRRHYNDLSWLSKEADDLYHVIRTGLLVPRLYHHSIEALFAIAPYMLRRDDFRRWSSLLLDALAAASNFPDETLRGRVFALVGQSDMLNGEIRQARQAYEITREIAGRIGDEDLLLLSYIGMLKAETFQQTSAYTDEVVERIQQVAQTVDSPQFDAWLNQTLCIYYAHRGRTQQALGFGMMALAYWLQRGNPLEIAKSLLALLAACHVAELVGYSELLLGEIEKHLPYAHSDQLYAVAAYHTGATAHFRGDYGRARDELRRARDNFERLAWRHHLAMSDHALGLVYIELGDYYEARARLMGAAQTWERLGAVYEFASAQHALGYLEAKRGSLDTGLALLRHARRLCQRIPRMEARTMLEGYIDEDIAVFDQLQQSEKLE